MTARSATRTASPPKLSRENVMSFTSSNCRFPRPCLVARPLAKQAGTAFLQGGKQLLELTRIFKENIMTDCEREKKCKGGEER